MLRIKSILNKSILESITTKSITTTATDAINQSSVPAGQVLKGINIYTNKKDPIALPDNEYPSWLWEISTGAKKDSASLFKTKESKLSASYIRYQGKCVLNLNSMKKKM